MANVPNNKDQDGKSKPTNGTTPPDVETKVAESSRREKRQRLDPIGICKSKQLLAKSRRSKAECLNSRSMQRRLNESTVCQIISPDVDMTSYTNGDSPVYEISNLSNKNNTSNEEIIIQDSEFHDNDASTQNANARRKRNSSTISSLDEGPGSPRRRKREDVKTGQCVVSVLSPETDIKSDMSPDSNKTVDYDCDSLSPYKNESLRCFSPLPSTSRDIETFERNDQRFMHSLTCDDDDDDVQIIESPCITIIIPDNDDEASTAPLTNSVVINEEPDEVLISYSNIPQYESGFGGDGNNSDCEIVDVDNIIAQNSALIQKFKMRHVPETSVVNVSPEPEERPDDTYTLLNLDTQQDEPRTKVQSTSACTSISPAGSSGLCNTSKHSKGNDKATIAHTITPNDTLPRNSVPSSIFEMLSSVVAFMANSVVTSGNKDMPNRQQINKYANGLTIIDSVDLSSPRNIPSTQPNVPATNQSLSSICESNNPRTTQVNTYDKNQAANEQIPAAKSQESTPNKSLTHAECPVCMESFASKQVVSTLCGHIFCLPCMLEIMRGQGYFRRCPTCRKTIKKTNGYHPIFL